MLAPSSHPWHADETLAEHLEARGYSGNLVCPAIYDLGQRANVVTLSVIEGEDKPLKYPVMFRAADLVVLTKSDLLPHLPDVDPKRIEEALGRRDARTSADRALRVNWRGHG